MFKKLVRKLKKITAENNFSMTVVSFFVNFRHTKLKKTEVIKGKDERSCKGFWQ